ncbi:putative alpha-D-xyloside xylohydrolase [Rosa chinensis]|uniref:Putative alpha-D-xyloside xylohydrolase n=1 Tax=Rosa chinensis TaxID=74649 RepID=A0A2P6R1R2_ROSCH|nr:putative alpha-D-xyloside xylohydrolase [Rosa chinensis]
MGVWHETQDRLRVHITDAEKQRWEVPYNLLPREQPRKPKQITARSTKIKASEHSGSKLVFSYTTDPFGFAVKRKSDDQVFFNSSSDPSDPFGAMVFKHQYIEISTKLPKDASLYGIGESTQKHGFRLHPKDPHTLFTADIAAFNLNTDLYQLYGSHPVYMDLRNVGGEAYAHAVLLLNINGMDVFYSGDSLTYKVIWGVFDFYFFAGTTPLEVVDTGISGFHQSRWGYQNLSVVEDIVENYQKAPIPLDVIWNDDDHMDRNSTPGTTLGQSFWHLGIGIANDVFIKHEGEPFLTQVAPGPVTSRTTSTPKLCHGGAPIGTRIIAASAYHYNGILEYNAHNLYGISETIATQKALVGLDGKRPFVLSRSTYVGSCKYAAHWTGDNKGTWDDLKYSNPQHAQF